jgi:hypothetical protein
MYDGDTIMSASERAMSGCLPNKSRSLQTTGHVLRPHQQPSYLPDHDEQNILITEGVVSVYLDDILIFPSLIEEHHHITQLVLDRMCEHKLYL